MYTQRKTLSLNERPDVKRALAGSQPTGSYSPGISAEGRFVFVSGQGPITNGEIVPGTVREQTLLTLSNVAAVLAQDGLGPADIVRCGVFLSSIDDFDEMDAAYREFFAGTVLPARTTVGAGLLGISVEIDCIAVAPS